LDFGLVVWVAAARVSSNQEGAAEGSCDSLSVVASVGPGALVSVLLPFGMGEWEEEIFGSARASDVEMSEPLAHLFSGSAQRRTAPTALAREDDERVGRGERQAAGVRDLPRVVKLAETLILVVVVVVVVVRASSLVREEEQSLWCSERERGAWRSKSLSEERAFSECRKRDTL